MSKKYVKKWEINVSHFDPYKHQKSADGILRINKKKPLENILIKNSIYNRGHLKKRLYDEGLLTPICVLCGQDETWQGKKMSLIMDHINGVRDDNRLENLRIVCPNCNATLDTHCGKNVTPKEDKRKRPGAKIDQRKVERPPLDVILDSVKEIGYAATGRKYRVSDNTIRKWIKVYKKYE